jgi:hypothetical protein
LAFDGAAVAFAEEGVAAGSGHGGAAKNRPIDLAGVGPVSAAASNGLGSLVWLPGSVAAVRSLLVCRGPLRLDSFVGAFPVTGWFFFRIWGDLCASAGAGRFPVPGLVAGAAAPVVRRLARWPSPRLPITSAAAWCPVVCGWWARMGASQCWAAQRQV